MVIVAGWLRVKPEDRGPYLETCRQVIVAARSAEGCIDFRLSADALDARRINVFEQWGSAEDVEAFRGSGPSYDQQTLILDARFEQHEIVSTTSLA